MLLVLLCLNIESVNPHAQTRPSDPESVVFVFVCSGKQVAGTHVISGGHDALTQLDKDDSDTEHGVRVNEEEVATWLSAHTKNTNERISS